MRFTLLITVLACVTMMSLQATDMTSSRRQLERYEARRISMTKQYWNARRRGFGLPEELCEPCSVAGNFIANQAMSCAMQALIPGSGYIGKAVKFGKKGIKKLGNKLGIMAK